MKSIFLTLLILILVPNTENVIGTYKIIEEFSSDTLELNEDGTYLYKGRGDSCWTWYDFSGEWEKHNETLILSETANTYEEEFVINEQADLKDNDSITIFLKTVNDKPLKDLTIEYYSINEKQVQVKKWNQNGILKFKKNDIVENKDEDSFIDIFGKINEKEVSTRLVSSRNSGQILITINLEPKKIIENRIHKFKIMKDSLMILDSKVLEIGKLYTKL
ncbi:hypothetical protein [uncultured Psychroserpens sp.]|uniref:hypothetical protein n=1 Tax=uncultured Psychroserpens sp. TaxID=255436 RepID=UPI00261D379C|nr:hypothetical protein [uncultured Psychroserpens sp.]